MNNLAFVASEFETRILIVSAHKHLREHYREILSDSGAQLFVVADAFEALEVIRTEAIHAVLSDFVLPGMCALSLFLTIKELFFPIPFVLCSADFSAKQREEVKLIGVFDVVRRPTLRQQIRSTLKLALEERERQLLQFYC